MQPKFVQDNHVLFGAAHGRAFRICVWTIAMFGVGCTLDLTMRSPGGNCVAS